VHFRWHYMVPEGEVQKLQPTGCVLRIALNRWVSRCSYMSNVTKGDEGA